VVFVAAVGLAHLIQVATAPEPSQAEERPPTETREPMSMGAPAPELPATGLAG